MHTTLKNAELLYYNFSKAQMANSLMMVV